MTNPNQKSILIVDDDPDLRQLLKLILGPLGYRITEAENGRVALELIADANPDLIILDMMMPEMNGIELLTIMIEDLGEIEAPILVTSAASDRARFMQQFFEMPIARKGFLRKPYSSDDLLAKVRELMGGEDLKPARMAPKPAEPQARPAQPRPGMPTKDLESFLESVLPIPPSTPAPAPTRPAPEPAQAKAKSAPDETPRQRLRALLIDDDEDLLDVLRVTLSPFHEVATATSGVTALTMLDEFAPDFIISDYSMPGLNGLQTIEAIRTHPRFHNLPVFLLTGHDDPNLPKKTFEVGGNLILRKPIDPNRLPRIIDTFVAEADIRPRAVMANRGKAAQPATAKPRVLIVDTDGQNLDRLQDFLEVRARGKLDLFKTPDPRVALGNLGRWEPDVILYNPRLKQMDGVMFVQNLRIQKIFDRFQIAFVGREFLNSDVEVSQKLCGRHVIALNAPDELVMKGLGEVINKAAARAGAKRYTIDEIRTEDRLREEELAAKRGKLERQREFLRERYMKIQDFIDTELKR